MCYPHPSSLEGDLMDDTTIIKKIWCGDDTSNINKDMGVGGGNDDKTGSSELKILDSSTLTKTKPSYKDIVT